MASSPESSTRERGRAAEQVAADLLAAHGLEIIDRNFTAAGAEVDLVAREPGGDRPDTCVFVEVRSRASEEHGSPLETVDATKQRRVARAATAWLVAQDLWERVEVRFDVIAVALGPNGEPQADPEWIRGAFEPG